MFRNRTALDQYAALPQVREQLRCIVAAGGDGTVTDLVNRHPGVPLAILPLGTENLLAGYFGLKPDGFQTAEFINAGMVRKLDSGMAAGRRFLLMWSAGVDAKIVHDVHSSRTGNIRRFNYLLPVIRGFCQYRPRPMTFMTDDPAQTATGTFLLVTNIPAYGMGFRFSPDAIPDDGLLDVRVFSGKTRLSSFLHAASVRLSCPWRESGVTRLLTRELTILPPDSNGVAAAPDAIPVQTDGDPAEGLPVKIGVDPKSLTLLVPCS